jgi:hypothetical protein
LLPLPPDPAALLPPAPLAPPAPPLAPPAPPFDDGGTHAPFTHTLPVVQSLSALQVVRQVLPAPSQVYAPHDAGTTMRQLPPPLQVRAGIDIAPPQLAAAHTVPLA